MRAKLKIPATLSFVALTLSACTDSTPVADARVDVAAESGTVDATIDAPLDAVIDVTLDRGGDLGSDDLFAEVAQPEDVGRCQNVSFIYGSGGCAHGVDYPDGREVIDAYDPDCAPDPEPNCS